MRGWPVSLLLHFLVECVVVMHFWIVGFVDDSEVPFRVRALRQLFVRMRQILQCVVLAGLLLAHVCVRWGGGVLEKTVFF